LSDVGSREPEFCAWITEREGAVLNVLTGNRGPLVLTAVLFVFAVSAPARDSSEWININKDYSGQRYVDLDQINPRNVQSLKKVCEAQLT